MIRNEALGTYLGWCPRFEQGQPLHTSRSSPSSATSLKRIAIISAILLAVLSGPIYSFAISPLATQRTEGVIILVDDFEGPYFSQVKVWLNDDFYYGKSINSDGYRELLIPGPMSADWLIQLKFNCPESLANSVTSALRIRIIDAASSRTLCEVWPLAPPYDGLAAQSTREIILSLRVKGGQVVT